MQSTSFDFYRLFKYMKNYFGKNLHHLRTSNNITQTDLAIKLNVSHQSISNYERGQRFCNLDMLVRVSELFDVSIDDLLKTPLDHN